MTKKALAILALSVGSTLAIAASSGPADIELFDWGFRLASDQGELAVEVDGGGLGGPEMMIPGCDLDAINSGGWSYEGCSNQLDGSHSNLHFSNGSQWCVINVGAPCDPTY